MPNEIIKTGFEALVYEQYGDQLEPICHGADNLRHQAEEVFLQGLVYNGVAFVREAQRQTANGQKFVETPWIQDKLNGTDIVYSLAMDKIGLHAPKKIGQKVIYLILNHDFYKTAAAIIPARPGIDIPSATLVIEKEGGDFYLNDSQQIVAVQSLVERMKKASYPNH